MRKIILFIAITLTTLSSFAQLNPSVIGLTASPITPTTPDIQSVLITTTSTRSDWQVDDINNSGETLVWRVTGGVELPPVTADRPILDLSTNTGSAVIRIESTTNFAGLIRMDLDGDIVPKSITDLDLAGAVELDTFSCKAEFGLQTLDVSNNVALTHLTVRDDNLAVLDVSDLPLLEKLYAYNNEFYFYEISNNPLLTLLNLRENNLSSDEMDYIVNTIESFGTSNGTLYLNTNPGSLTSASYTAWQALNARGWTMDETSPPPPNPPSGDAPVLFNFTVDDAHKDRVYFESTEVITATTTTGFVIFDHTISSIHINTDATEGHYFLLSAPMDYWDVDLIKYTGGSNIQDTDSHIVYDFTLQYIDNLIEQPVGNQPDKYVTTTGGTGAGTIGDPWSFEYAGQNAVAGTTVWVKAGNYGADNIVIANNGTADNPIRFIGYDNTIGDAISLNRENLRTGVDNFDSSVMPMLTGGSGQAIFTNNKNFIVFKNIQVDGNNYGYERAIYLNNSNHIIVDNCYFKSTSNYMIYPGDGDSGYSKVINSYFQDSRSGGMKLQNQHNLIENTWAVSTFSTSSMDYYLLIYGGNVGKSNVVRGCYVNRNVNDNHSGHGISFKADQHLNGWYIEESLMENNEIIGSRIEIRHFPVKNNVIRNTTVTNGNGITIRDGASDNIFENIYIKDCSYFVRFNESVEHLAPDLAPNNNKFYNCIIDNVDLIFETGEYLQSNPNDIFGTEVINCTFNDVDALYTADSNFNATMGSSNIMTNNIFNDVRASGSGNESITFTYNNFYLSWQSPSTDGNFSVDPQLNASYQPQANFDDIDIPRGDDVLYDKNGNERNASLTTVGAVIHTDEEVTNTIITFDSNTLYNTSSIYE